VPDPTAAGETFPRGFFLPVLFLAPGEPAVNPGTATGPKNTATIILYCPQWPAPPNVMGTGSVPQEEILQGGQVDLLPASLTVSFIPPSFSKRHRCTQYM